jgi:Secretion system C-terminal sorting domain
MKQLLTLILVCTCVKMQAQTNLVLNPSFEQYSGCPTNIDQIKYAEHWNGIDTLWSPGDSDIYEPYCLPEYCNVCVSNYFCCSIPGSVWYYQYPRTGLGMTQVTMYFDDSYSQPSQRDYLQGKLYSTLVAGRTYCLTFYVNFEGSGNTTPSCYAVDHIGAYLDDGSIDTNTTNCGYPQSQYTPQVYTNTIITDTVNWTMIQGRFTANGNERFITIGNFFDDAHTDVVNYCGPMANNWGLYLIDDVSVIPSDATANAGPDGVVSPGSDSAWIGPHEEGWPCKWYVVGDTGVYSYYTGFKVHPDTTTSYVMELDLCDNTTWDTVTVFVAPAGVSTVTLNRQHIFPNPTSGICTIEYAGGAHIALANMLGQQVAEWDITSDRQQLDISSLPCGVYNAVIADPATGQHTVQRLIRQ